MDVPPPPFDSRRVLEYVVFDESVHPTSLKLLRPVTGEATAIAAMVICEFPGDPPTIQLCYCDSSWNIDSINFWRLGGPSMPFVSLTAVRALAERRFTGTLGKWVTVAQLSEKYHLNHRPLAGTVTTGIEAGAY